jgi:hypothetical protein
MKVAPLACGNGTVALEVQHQSCRAPNPKLAFHCQQLQAPEPNCSSRRPGTSCSRASWCAPSNCRGSSRFVAGSLGTNAGNKHRVRVRSASHRCRGGAAEATGPPGDLHRRGAKSLGSEAAKELWQRHPGLKQSCVASHRVRPVEGCTNVTRPAADRVNRAEARFVIGLAHGWARSEADGGEIYRVFLMPPRCF